MNLIDHSITPLDSIRIILFMFSMGDDMQQEKKLGNFPPSQQKFLKAKSHSTVYKLNDMVYFPMEKSLINCSRWSFAHF